MPAPVNGLSVTVPRYRWYPGVPRRILDPGTVVWRILDGQAERTVPVSGHLRVVCG